MVSVSVQNYKKSLLEQTNFDISPFSSTQIVTRWKFGDSIVLVNKSENKLYLKQIIA